MLQSKIFSCTSYMNKYIKTVIIFKSLISKFVLFLSKIKNLHLKYCIKIEQFSELITQ